MTRLRYLLRGANPPKIRAAWNSGGPRHALATMGDLTTMQALPNDDQRT
jgi:hypothetical protein